MRTSHFDLWRDKLLIFYYLLGTPVFVLSDLLLEASFRAAFLDQRPLLKYSYYGACWVLGFLVRYRPHFASVIGLCDSIFNIVMLALSVMLPWYEAIDLVATGDVSEAQSAFGNWSPANFVIAGAILLLSFYRNPIIMNSPSLDDVYE